MPVLVHRGDNFLRAQRRVYGAAAWYSELVADDWNAYVERAIELTADVEALDRLRARIRRRSMHHPIATRLGFTRILENAYRQMYAKWIDATA